MANPSYQIVGRYMGEGYIPQDVQRARHEVYDAMRRFGSPVLVKKMYTSKDVQAGIAQLSPVADDVYVQSRNFDPLSHGVGFVSAALSAEEWFNPVTGTIITSDTNPGAPYFQAPLYRGYGQGYLTYLIEPDAPEDMFKINEIGTFEKIQTATAQAPWYPSIEDNDLIINVTLNPSSGALETAQERYVAKMSNPTTMRGINQMGRRERDRNNPSSDPRVRGGNRYVINQTFQMTLVPDSDALMLVETDR